MQNGWLIGETRKSGFEGKIIEGVRASTEVAKQDY